MTRERLARLRFLANFAAYHVPSADSEPSNLMDADAGDDMLELCAAVDAAVELLESARIDQELQMRGYVLATARALGKEAEEIYRSAGAPGLRDWARRKRESAIAKAEGRS